MTLHETQSRIKANVWQAIAQNDLDVSCLDKQTVEALVDLVTEAALLDADAEMGKSLAAAGAPRQTNIEPHLCELALRGGL